MPAPLSFKYRAFLSYAHADKRWADWLHPRLEKFGIDKDLVGHATPLGPVPRTLRPIFRDREDFAGGHSLTDATVAALDQSVALIVLCSPVAATRPAVNEEVRLYRWRHPERPVIPVIVDGDYPGNFPPALRFEIAADGTITDRPVTILGPDLREHADGRERGLAKIVAGLTGIAVEDVRKRQLIAERGTVIRFAAIVAVVAVLGLVAGFLWWQAERQREHAASLARQMQEEREATRSLVEQQTRQIGALARQLALIAPAQAGTGTERAIDAAIEAAAKGAERGDARLQRALDLLGTGNVNDAELLFRAVAEEKGGRVAQDKREAAAAYRHLGAIAGLGDPKRALAAHGKALEFEPDDTEALYWHGYLNVLAEDANAAERSLHQLLRVASARSDQRGLYRAHLRLGQSMLNRGGNLAAALDHSDRALRIAFDQSTSWPEDVDWQSDLAEAKLRRGNVVEAQGKLDEALTAFRDSLSIRERLVQADPGNARWQRDLSVSQEKIGDVLVEQIDLPAALDAFKVSLAIRERLARSVPGNAGYQRNLSVSLEKIGDVLVAQGNLPAALDSFKASLAIADRLAKADPGHSGWQRDLAVSHNKIGDVLVDQGNIPAGLNAFVESHAIFERLAKADPGNAGWQRDLALSFGRVAMVDARQAERQRAVGAFRNGREIIARLRTQSPDNAMLPKDLAWFEAQIAALEGK